MPGGEATAVGAARPELRGMTGLRALAAGWVVIEHYRLVTYALIPESRTLEAWIRSGWLGVEVFFILSGFIIAYNYADRFTAFTWRTYRQFLQLRFARIYPVHLATLVALAIVVIVARGWGVSFSGADSYTPWSFIGNVFVLQALPWVSTWNSPAWSISAEFAAYILFPVLALLIARVRTARRGFVLAAIIAVIGVLAMLWVGAVVDESPTGSGLIWLRIATEFTIGCLLYAGWRHLGTKKFGIHWDWIAGGALLVTLGLVGVIGGEGATALVLVPAIAVFVLGCAGATGWVGWVLSRRVMLWGGRVSYSVYMTHFILLMVFGDIVDPQRFIESTLLVRLAVVTFYFAAAIGVGAACYYLVEEPGRRIIRRLIGRSARPTPKGEATVPPDTRTVEGNPVK